MLRSWIALLLLAQISCIRTERPPLARAAEYLWRQQAEDGGWHSHTYGLLRSGQALTPFVLEALLQVPEGTYPMPRAGVDRAIAFIRNNTRSDGALGSSLSRTDGMTAIRCMGPGEWAAIAERRRRPDMSISR